LNSYAETGFSLEASALQGVVCRRQRGCGRGFRNLFCNKDMS